MPVTAKFVPEHIELLPNVTTTSTVRLYNDDGDTRAVVLSVAGDFRDHARFESTTATIETNQIVDVAVTLFSPSTVEAGSYSIVAEVGSAPVEEGEQPAHPAGELAVATASVDVVARSDYAIALQPPRSRGSRRGRHVIRVANTGNVPLVLAVTAEPTEGGLDVEIGRASLTVAAGAAADVPVSVIPAASYWSGPTREYDFALRATSADGRSDELVGAFQQRPRVPNWVGPAAAGALAALLVGAIVWFALLRPWVNDTADTAAADAIEQDRAALRERIAELETAAAEAKELPLGTPIDFRLEVAPASGNVEEAAAVVEAGTIVSITDVVFQNPTGAVGTVSLRRGDDVILQSELANFRDFDLHFVAPFQFGDDVEIVLDVECRTPGNGASVCPVAASLVGFVDETD
jgi:hypothetical protein